MIHKRRVYTLYHTCS